MEKTKLYTCCLHRIAETKYQRELLIKEVSLLELQQIKNRRFSSLVVFMQVCKNTKPKNPKYISANNMIAINL